jgi:hypothetical protein
VSHDEDSVANTQQSVTGRHLFALHLVSDLIDGTGDVLPGRAVDFFTGDGDILPLEIALIPLGKQIGRFKSEWASKQVIEITGRSNGDGKQCS